MGRSVESNRRIRSERHQAILAASLDLFASRGLAATKVADIAEAAAISPGLVYHYFSSKGDIFVLLVDRAISRLNEAAAELEALAISPADKLRLALGGLLKNLEESEDAARTHLFMAQAAVSEATPEAARVVMTTRGRLPYDTIERIIRAGQDAGTVQTGDAGAMAQLFWSTIKGLALHRAVDGENYRSPEPAVLLRMFLVEGD